MRYLIIGNGAAAVGGVEGIRSVDAAGEITVLGAEPLYARPLISYLLAGKTSPERMGYRPADFYEKMNAQVREGVTVESINPAAHKITLAGGESLPYDKLLVATGSSPIVPPIEGLTGVSKRFTFLSLADARALEAELTPESRVLVVGAGLIGLKCAEGILERVAQVTVVDMAAQILPSVLDAGAAARVQAHLEKHGVAFQLGQTVTRFEGDKALLSGGEGLDFDILVLAVGVRANTALVKEAGGQVGRGIAVDADGRTTLPDVFAAGDCVESHDLATGETRVLAILPNASMQGFAAGAAMAGGAHACDKCVAMNALCFLGLHALTAGAYVGEAHERITESQYKRLFVEDDRLKGFILVGDVDRAGIYTALIREQTPLSTLDFDLIFDKPQLMAFSRTERVQRMGGLPK
ncbi:MAG: FAD-dependent oxidoreductase [Oscillospiraceae bacterium]|jgi:NAD(P)H-nitrite reductase large subunit|nr:FAD-dependent oxidoreductase [Oscillospiraceae bacterium]